MNGVELGFGRVWLVGMDVITKIDLLLEEGVTVKYDEGTVTDAKLQRK